MPHKFLSLNLKSRQIFFLNLLAAIKILFGPEIKVKILEKIVNFIFVIQKFTNNNQNFERNKVIFCKFASLFYSKFVLRENNEKKKIKN